MTRTPNYDLSQYGAEDRVTRESFNADNAAVDTALKAVADAASAAQSAAANAPQLFIGTYTGNGSASQEIELGFRPKAVYVCRKDGATMTISGSTVFYHYGGLAVSGRNVTTMNANAGIFIITNTGFRVYNSTSTASDKDIVRANESGTGFNYVAVK